MSSSLSSFQHVVERLEPALRRELPGPDAQALLAPRPRQSWRPGQAADGCRQAAALLAVYPRGSRAHVLLTLRHAALPAHGGQISLPGGAIDDGESTSAAALREAWEEVALPPESVRLLGPLTSLHIPASGFHLHPVVGVIVEPPRLHPDDREVARILEVPLEVLGAADTLQVEHWSIRGTAAEVPFFRLDGLKLWGATAMVLAEFLSLLGAPPDPWCAPSEPHPGDGTVAASESDPPTEIIR